MSQDPKYIEAKRHVDSVKGFYIHLFVFSCVMAGLIAINVGTKTEWWAQWPLIGWGVGVLGHAVAVFMPFRLFGRDWEEKKIKERLERN